LANPTPLGSRKELSGHDGETRSAISETKSPGEIAGQAGPPSVGPSGAGHDRHDDEGPAGAEPSIRRGANWAAPR
jgi:hypothetical protein